MDANAPILFFDSGVGGLSVLEPTRALLPNAPIVYAADNSGHSMATNLAVPLLYPKLRVKFGNLITYADDPFSHLKTEFGFDVFQAAKGRYAPDGYKGFIGFELSKLARAGV